MPQRFYRSSCIPFVPPSGDPAPCESSFSRLLPSLLLLSESETPVEAEAQGVSANLRAEDQYLLCTIRVVPTSFQSQCLAKIAASSLFQFGSLSPVHRSM